VSENSDIPPDIDAAQAKRINHYLTKMRDDLYRIAEGLQYNDPSRSRLWELAGTIEDEKVSLLRRCSECRKKEMGRDEA